MSIKDSQIDKKFGGLCVYIMEYDSFRSPVVVGINQFSRELVSKRNQRVYFIKNNRDLHHRMRKKLYSYFEIYYDNLNKYAELNLRYSVRYKLNMHNMAKKESDSIIMRDLICNDSSLPSLLPFNYFMILGVLVIGMSFLFLDSYGFNIFTVLLSIIISSGILYTFLAGISTRIRGIAGKKYDYDIKEVINELIIYATGLIKENNINPEDFPLKLRHDDYDGLVYEKKGKNKFIGVFKK